MNYYYFLMIKYLNFKSGNNKTKLFNLLNKENNENKIIQAFVSLNTVQLTILFDYIYFNF